MAFIDIIIIGLALLGAVRGYLYGLMSGLASVAGAVAGIVACRLFGDDAYALLARHTDVETFPGAPYSGSVLSYLLVFVPVYVICRILGHLMKGILSAVRLGGIARLGGAVFGGLKYMLVLSIVLNTVYIIAPDSNIFSSSHLLEGSVFRFVMDFAPYLWGLDILPNPA